LEIESCSSGGARIDAGVLQRTQRVWPSDTNDAHDRQAIMRWTSLLVPLEYLGAHVGSAPAHTTGRSQSLAFRLATALFGHAGIEWDLSAAEPEELAALRVWAQRYKELRGLLHSGDLVRGDDGGDPVVTGVVAADRSEAVFVISCLESPRESVRLTRRLPGLDTARNYEVSVVDLGVAAASHAGIPPRWVAEGITLPGSVLGAVGLEPPLLLPDEAIVVRVHAV
jgi:alpha-galactosidase